MWLLIGPFGFFADKNNMMKVCIRVAHPHYIIIATGYISGFAEVACWLQS